MRRDATQPPTPLFPPPGQPALDVLWLAWDALDDALILVAQGDLSLLPLATPDAPALPLTAEGAASHPQWGP